MLYLVGNVGRAHQLWIGRLVGADYVEGCLNRRKPLHAMREYVTVLHKLFARVVVTGHSEFLNLDGVERDIIHGDARPRAIPIHIGATGDTMLELAGEIVDGVVLNYMVLPAYIHKMEEYIAAGCNCPIMYSLQDDARPMSDVSAKAFPL